MQWIFRQFPAILMDFRKKTWVLFWLGSLAPLGKFDLTWGTFHLAPWLGIVTAVAWSAWWVMQWKNLKGGWRWLACLEWILSAAIGVLWGVTLFRSGECLLPSLQKPFDIAVVAGVIAVAWNIAREHRTRDDEQSASVWRKVAWLWLVTGLAPAAAALLLWPVSALLKRSLSWECHWFPLVAAMVFVFFAWPAMALANAIAHELALARRATRILAWGTGAILLMPVWMLLPWTVHCWVTPSFDAFIAAHPAQSHEPSTPVGASENSLSLDFAPEKRDKKSEASPSPDIRCGNSLQMVVSHGDEQLLDAAIDLDFLFHGEVWSYEKEPAIPSTLESVRVAGKVISHDPRFHGEITAWVEPQWDAPEVEQVKSNKDGAAYPLKRWNFAVRYSVVLAAGPGDVSFRVVRASHLPTPTYTKEELAARQAMREAMLASFKQGSIPSPSVEVKSHPFQELCAKHAEDLWGKSPPTPWDLLFPRAAQLPEDGWKFEGGGGGTFFVTEGKIVRKYPRGAIWKPGSVDDWIQTWGCRHGKLESFGRFNCEEYSHGWKTSCVAREGWGAMSGTSTESSNENKTFNCDGKTW